MTVHSQSVVLREGRSTQSLWDPGPASQLPQYLKNQSFLGGRKQYLPFFLPPLQFVWFKIFNPRHNEVSHLQPSPGPLDWDFTLIMLMNVLLTHANFRIGSRQRGEVFKVHLSRADLITQAFRGQSRAVLSQLF